MPTVALIGCFDTKGQEYLYVAHLLRQAGCEVLSINTGVMGEAPFQPDISAEEVASVGGESLEALRQRGDRGYAVTVMARGVVPVIRQLYEAGRIQGVLGLGGSAGTTIGTSVMRALPVGVPKLMVSTLASGNTLPYVDTKDILMMYSVVDVAGLNRVSRRILANAALAMAGMVQAEIPPETQGKKVVGATMFGVTTPCVNYARELLEAQGMEVLIFHATGTGGRAMEGLMADGYIQAVLDVTTTELADELVGGILSAGPDRLNRAGELGLPQVVAPGALDMVNFGPWDTVPEVFRQRRLYRHNPTVTLMRTTPEEMAELGRIMGEKLSRSKGPTTFLMPLKGVSAIDREGQPFYWPEANEAFRQSLKAHLGERVEYLEVDAHINDPKFAEALVDHLLKNMSQTEGC